MARPRTRDQSCGGRGYIPEGRGYVPEGGGYTPEGRGYTPDGRGIHRPGRGGEGLHSPDRLRHQRHQRGIARPIPNNGSWEGQAPAAYEVFSGWCPQP
eukprot:4290505-Pyramimonas_sp.AAC.1